MEEVEVAVASSNESTAPLHLPGYRMLFIGSQIIGNRLKSRGIGPNFFPLIPGSKSNENKRTFRELDKNVANRFK